MFLNSSHLIDFLPPIETAKSPPKSLFKMAVLLAKLPLEKDNPRMRNGNLLTVSTSPQIDIF